MGRKFTDFKDLTNYLDNESLGDDETEMLGDEDLSLIQFPRPVQAQPQKKQAKRTHKPKS